MVLLHKAMGVLEAMDSSSQINYILKKKILKYKIRNMWSNVWNPNEVNYQSKKLIEFLKIDVAREKKNYIFNDDQFCI